MSESITSEEAKALAKSMGLLPHELEHIESELGRLPTRTELTVFAGMWSEHCAYKSTRQWLKDLPTKSELTLAGPGSHAGVVSVSDDWAVAFKIESHNHPSAVEPYQGAATGVGGILRDIIAQGARPCAIMDSLCFGMPDTRRNRRLRDGVVDGIAGYGNAFGVPNLGGRTVYDSRYDGNPLVNALAAGLVRKDGMRTANAKGIGNAVLYVGAATGRDGILGAAFASEELEDDTTEDRPHVQVGDPFAGKKLMEACLSFTEEMGMVACQDMGASGVTCATFEMAAAGGVGIEIDLETIPLREANMTPQEIMLSESQERFMFVVEKGHEDAAVAHFQKYGVHAVVCGRVIEGSHGRALYKGEVVVDLPAALVADGAPLANWPVADELPPRIPYPAFDAPADLGAAMLRLLADPSIADKEDLYSHYDQTVGNRTARAPGNAEAGVLKLPGSSRGFALTIQSRGDICAVDPYLGAQSLLASACRNLACAGAEMLAITDGLNVASPRDPVENLRLRETIRGLGDGLRGLGVPVTGGNCSLYNESSRGPIPPTPMVGALGRVEDVSRVPRHQPNSGDVLFLLGRTYETPVASRYGALMAQSEAGDAPMVDLVAEKRLAAFLIAQCSAGRVRCAKDGDAGGIGVALAKLCLAGNVGAEVSLPEVSGRIDWHMFGEYPATAWVGVAADAADGFLQAADDAGVGVHRAGEFTGDALLIRGHIQAPLAELRRAFTSTSRANP